MALPVFAPFPPPAIRASFAAEQWRECLDAWSILTTAYLQAEDRAFKAASDASSFNVFLQSYYEQWSPPKQKPAPGPDALKHNCFLLVQKCQRLDRQNELLADLKFLSHFSRAHLKSPELTQLLSQMWESSRMQKTCQQWKTLTIQDLDNRENGQTRPSLGTITPLLYSSSELAAFVMTGSDFLDSAMTAYIKDDRPAVRKTLVIVVYLGLLSLVKSKHVNTAALSDHLYSLKAQADSVQNESSLLADLVTNTPLLKTVQHHIPASDSDRTHKLVESLRTYRMPSIARKQKRSAKGKHRMLAHPDDMHVHRMSLITQIQDLFPDLGSGFILRLLDEYNDHVEELTAHLLDGSLPGHLMHLDRSEKAGIYEHDQRDALEHLAPRSTPPIPDTFIPHRANIFDEDDFDRLEIDSSKLHIGKKPDNIEESGASDKAAILAALAAFDSDDDERDDTYDIEDVGGTVDTAHHDGDDSAIALSIDENDMILYKLHQATPEVFSRAAETRRSRGRASLKEQTGMTDEAIEGWAIMLQRDPKRQRRLALEASKFDGRQHEVTRTAYRGQLGGTDTEDSDVAADRELSHVRGRGGARGRGRGRGGSVAGPSSDAATANAQRRKEANKGSRANHNRRDQRARKMARGGFPGAS